MHVHNTSLFTEINPNLFLSTGKFTNAQRILYEALLEVQELCIRECVVGSTLQDNYNKMLELIGTQLQKIGIAPKTAKVIPLVMVSA